MIIAGFIDDQFGLPPVFRLLVQLIAALLLVSTGLRIGVGFRREFLRGFVGLLHSSFDHGYHQRYEPHRRVDGLAGE